jgi:hypothetical protein
MACRRDASGCFAQTQWFSVGLAPSQMFWQNILSGKKLDSDHFFTSATARTSGDVATKGCCVYSDLNMKWPERFEERLHIFAHGETFDVDAFLEKSTLRPDFV